MPSGRSSFSEVAGVIVEDWDRFLESNNRKPRNEGFEMRYDLYFIDPVKADASQP